MGNPVLRGDLRARSRSPKVWVLEAVYLGVLGALVFLGLPPELGRLAGSRDPSLSVAVLWVQIVLLTYYASACLAQEILVEGEKAAVDLVFAPFPAAVIVGGKSLSSLVTILYWLLLGAPLLVLTAAIRQIPIGSLLSAAGLIAVVAWGIGQMGLLYSVLFEAEFSRTVAHWMTLLAIFAGTTLLPSSLRSLNPVEATTAAAGGFPPAIAVAAYAGLGAFCGLWTWGRLRRLAAA
ncbi:MAG: hypothetical protein E6H00_06380 [Bacillati bacterium ANGP1]|uniref:ABC transporter permease n=1 Tax=Candidatus Segetimicrobium genomatis TaxID=2569760 RepID=A0A537K537_9BACT|nr:MAG: hypothetical protein E6H00_06380 [Terrabacteria group bacterium ANGP1]